MNLKSNLPAIRKMLRQQRCQLTPDEYTRAAQCLTERFTHHPLFINSSSIAAYLPYQGEINPIGIMQIAWKLKKSVYIPTLHPSKPHHLQFVRWTPDMPLSTNRYGILEPRAGKIGQMQILDLVLLPLLGFDAQCNRLGTGGGYYDRTFAFLQKQIRPTKPILVGLAYELQQIENLPVEPWDVPLDGVITEKKYYSRNIG